METVHGSTLVRQNRAAPTRKVAAAALTSAAVTAAAVFGRAAGVDLPLLPADADAAQTLAAALAVWGPPLAGWLTRERASAEGSSGPARTLNL